MLRASSGTPTSPQTAAPAQPGPAGSALAGAAQSLIQLHHAPQYAQVAKREGVGRTVNALLNIKTTSRETQRPPLELCLVLDISGSMEGTKLENCKTAIRYVINNLSRDDIFHVVKYNHMPKTLFQNMTIDTLPADWEAQVQSIKSCGGTHILSAMSHAAALFRSDPGRRGDATRLRRMFLYSDGKVCEPNAPHCSLAADFLADLDVSTSTFGIGEDYNRELMEGIAESGNGHYDFVTVRRVEEITSRALRSATRVIASRAVVSISDVVCGVAVKFLSGGNIEGDAITVGDLRSDNMHQILIEVALPDTLPAVDATVTLFKATLDYCPVDNPLAYCSVEADGKFTFTNGGADGEPVVSVCAALALHKLSLANRTVQELIERDCIAEAEALLRRSLQDLAVYEESDDTGFVATQLRRGNRTLDRLSRGGSSHAQRVSLELAHQAVMMDNLSAADFESSASGHSIVSPRAAPQRGGSVQRRGSFGSSGGSSSGSDSPRLAPVMFAPHQRALVGMWNGSDIDSPQSSPRSGPASPRSVGSDAADLSPVLLPPGMTEASRIPTEFLCPITSAIMTEPVSTMDGQTYDRAAIEQWFSMGKHTSPATGARLTSLSLIPNIALRSMIANWVPPAPEL